MLLINISKMLPHKLKCFCYYFDVICSITNEKMKYTLLYKIQYYKQSQSNHLDAMLRYKIIHSFEIYFFVLFYSV